MFYFNAGITTTSPYLREWYCNVQFIPLLQERDAQVVRKAVP